MPALHPRFSNRALPICVLALVGSICLPKDCLTQFTYVDAVPILRSISGNNATAGGDFDGDGDEDIVTTVSGIQLISNNGNGTFLMPTPLQGSSTTIYRSIEAVDLDLDGDLDLLVTSQDTDEVGWLENDGSANFSLFQLISNELNDPTRAFAADLDNDGDLDLVTSSHSDNKVTWFERTAGNTFDGPHIVVSNANGAECVYAADLDGDGLKDIMVAARWANRVAWYKNLGGNDFSGTNLISSTAEGARWVDAQDLDGDGDLDVLSASGADDTLQWFENAGDGTFSEGNVLELIKQWS